MTFDSIILITGTVAQVVLAITAIVALTSWKIEARGKDRIKFAKNLLEYIENIRFLIYHPREGGVTQVYLNDLLENRKRFYTEHIPLIKNKKVFFDENAWELFRNMNTRSNIFIPEKIRKVLDPLVPKSGKIVDTKSVDLDLYYISVGGIKNTKHPPFFSGKNVSVYDMYEKEGLTFEEYFNKWEQLIVQIKKLL